MKTLSIGSAFILLLFLTVTKAFPAHYASDVAPSTKTFVDTYNLPVGEQVTIDIYLSDDIPPPLLCQNAGGVWIDFSGSTGQIAYVSAGRAFSDGSEGPFGPWTSGAGALVNEPAGPGTLVLVVAGLGGECPDADGDLIVGRVVFEMVGTGEASIIFTTIPGVATWTPYPDADVLPHTLIITDDLDNDGIANGQDNCPDTPNGPKGGTCTAGVSYKVARPCLSDGECGDGGFCSMNQEDSNQDGIGDACYLCEADFTCDGDVDADDMADFLNHFGRSRYSNPCETGKPCSGDFTCDGDVDADDVPKYLEDFGRSQFNNPCPQCVAGDWCNYSVTTSTTTVPVTTTVPTTTSMITTTIPPLCALTISPSGETVYTWETVQFGTTLRGDCNAPCYDWEVVTGIGSTIDSDGLYTAGGTTGTDTVTVTDNCNEAIFDAAVVEVLFPTSSTTTIP